MTYYPTLDEDLQRAKEILTKGREPLQPLPPLPPGMRRDEDATVRLEDKVRGGTIYGADTFAAYKLLESFVTEIERLHQQVKAHGQVTLDIAALLDDIPSPVPENLFQRVQRVRDDSENYQLLLALLGVDNYKDAVRAITGLKERVRFTESFEELKHRMDGLEK